MEILMSRLSRRFNEHTKAHPKRAKFFSLISEDRTVEQAVASCLHVPLYRRVLSKGKRWVKMLVKIIFGNVGVTPIKKVLGK